jgi:hypothetical protein
MLESARRPEMQGQMLRKFTLLDAMTLVAATAVAFSVARLNIMRATFGPEPPSWSLMELIRRRGGDISICLLIWTLTLFVLRCVRPHPTLNRLVQQPGFAAGYATLIGVFWRSLSIPKEHISAHKSLWVPASDWFMRLYRPMFHLSSYSNSMCIVAVWLTLWLTGHWYCEKDWIENTGRLLGWLWIALFVALMVVPNF